ncbi:wax ester/triacylglycerol synthase family O-acyltransferase [Acidiferrimicrobium sp. IK]|uniref:wax ester/triacylglycerol synthase family O-acyltransferase n=1 Tax=Acidiferrimicrobium sp. IK TaxID=2871700 RepID=UPI0021CB58EC|nr:wax ester/triacylglycerol synthase family O-acyltransferase [Acidiferrimicrobium sp. IK]MCU4187010.1 wax ester/triacylglycerol synthase family O-acyltransferase [Acidiferrimicrobium sp. IK]
MTVRHQLSGTDSGLLSLELPSQPMHSVALMVLGCPEPGGHPMGIDELRGHVTARLAALPALRWRLAAVPLGLGRPVLVDDTGFDVSAHVRAERLPAPGTAKALDRYVAAGAERRLPRDRPLWDLTLVDGLEDGRQALAFRFHHCLMDGRALLATLAELLPHAPAAPAPGIPGRWEPLPFPSRRRLLLTAARQHAGAVGRLPALVARTRRTVAEIRAERLASPAPPPTKQDAPWTPLNVGLGASRSVARVALPLEEVRRIRSRAAVTVNDVVLAAVAGALRAYLLDAGALPDRPLVARVPVVIDPAGPVRTYGNRFAALSTSLRTDISDPAARLAAIAAAAGEAKRLHAMADPMLMSWWLEQIPPALAERAVRRGVRLRRDHPERIEWNVVVSNVRSYREARHLGSQQLEELYLTGPPNGGVGVNISVTDYCDRLFVGVLAFSDSLDRPGDLAAHLRAAVDELGATVEEAAGSLPA